VLRHAVQVSIEHLAQAWAQMFVRGAEFIELRARVQLLLNVNQGRRRIVVVNRNKMDLLVRSSQQVPHAPRHMVLRS